MPYEDNDLYTHRGGQWKILPRWAKLVTVVIGLPAFLVLFGSIFLEDIGGAYQEAAFSILLGIVAFQGIFIIRAYWRMEL